MTAFTLDTAAQLAGRQLASEVEKQLDADLLTLIGPLLPGLDRAVLTAAESLLDSNKRPKLAVVLSTGGGVVEIAEQLANIFRHHWSEVVFVVPDRAMSAGTVLAMSGDAILMDYSSMLGPIDPQVARGNKLVPALSYLTQFDRIMSKFRNGDATTGDYALLDKFDLAELHQFEEARELSISLLENWLVRFKFKDWTATETQGLAVSDEMKRDRAKEIARQLSNHEHWHSHSRGISMQVLRRELNLRIDDFGSSPELRQVVRGYFDFLRDYAARNEFRTFVHTRNFF